LKKILDEFTELPKKRQQKYQMRQRALGLCIKGDKRKILKWGLCRKHVAEVLRKKRENYGKLKEV